MDESARSKNGVRIRLTDERWAHVTEEHCELAGMRQEVLETISSLDMILDGKYGASLALRQIDGGRYLVAVYRESTSDGFIITAFITSRKSFIVRRKRLWPV